jgi:trimethylamine--corrinoid protein Co-methyltransferase
MIYGAGMLEAGMTFSLGQLVIDDEISAMVKRIVGGISVERELMGVDLIKKVGIVREEWVKEGSPSLIQTANKRAAQLLASHEPKPLSEDLVNELKRIVKSVE